MRVFEVKNRKHPDRYVAELVTFGYKEPLTPTPNGFGFLGSIRMTKDHIYVECHICGELYENVGFHSYLAHGVTVKKYKEKYGIARTTSLVGEEYRQTLKANKLRWYHSLSEKEKREYHAKGYEVRKQNGFARKKEVLEVKNKKGTCPDQLLDRIKKLQAELGKTPTMREFDKLVGHNYRKLICKTFGTWNNAVEKAGLPINKKGGIPWAEEDLLKFLRIYYETHKRLPTRSDGDRGLIPSASIYKKWFGSLPRARSLAGLPDGNPNFLKKIFI